MNQELVDEIEYTKELLANSGFFNREDIIEILEEQFIEEDIDFSNIEISFSQKDNSNFKVLENAFIKLSGENIIAIHNCGYDIEEGVTDAFELFVHLKNNKYDPVGFCFYTFEDVEEAIENNNLKITFGDFENNTDKALEIGKIVFSTLKESNFDVNWDETVNNQIEISIEWDKIFDENKEYEEIKKNVMAELKKQLRPEFINRIDDIIVFHKLNDEEINSIIDLLLKNVEQRLVEQGLNIKIDKSVKELIAKKGVDKEFGARPLRRAIQNIVEDKLAEEILDGNIKPGLEAKLVAKDDKVELKVKATK